MALFFKSGYHSSGLVSKNLINSFRDCQSFKTQIINALLELRTFSKVSPTLHLIPWASDGTGTKHFDPGRVGSISCCSGQVSHPWFGSGFGKFPLKNLKFFNFFPSGQKVPGWKTSRPLIYCGSKVCSDRVGTGQGPSLPWADLQGTSFRHEICFTHCVHIRSNVVIFINQGPSLLLRSDCLVHLSSFNFILFSKKFELLEALFVCLSVLMPIN